MSVTMILHSRLNEFRIDRSLDCLNEVDRYCLAGDWVIADYGGGGISTPSIVYLKPLAKKTP